jgi:hypothetical protein
MELQDDPAPKTDDICARHGQIPVELAPGATPMSKTEVSDRKRAANRANAQKSTGPKTVEGKSRSRLNAVTHGLTAETVVLPTEDSAAFEAERRGWIEDWKPETQTRMILVERAAAQAWRLRRCVRVETSRLTKIANQAAASYDNALNAKLARGLRLLEVDPPAGLEALSNDPNGIELLISLWANLARSATAHGWTDIADHHNRYINLLGRHADEDPDDLCPEGRSSFLLLRQNLGDLPEGETIDRTEATSIANAIILVARRHTDALIRKLEWYADPAAIRTREIESVCIDASPEGLALHRYEATHDRAFRSTLAQLAQMAKSGSDLLAPNEATDGITDCVPEACEPKSEPDSAPASAARASSPASARSIAPNEPTEDPSRTPDRDREGRIWAVEATDPGLLDQ